MSVLNPKTVANFLTYEKEDKKGFLWKKRSDNKGSYKKRYFILCGNILAYFEKKLDKDPLGIIFLECHVVEMINDYKMAIRFRGPGELCHSYILKSEFPDEIQDWMHYITRSGIEVFNLTLEDFEDHYKALTTIKRSPQSLSNKNDIAKSTQSSVGRLNPFNKTIPQNKQSHNQSINPSMKLISNYTKWLLSKTFDDLNSLLIDRYLPQTK